MDADVIMCRSAVSLAAAYHVSRLMYEPHIYNELCDEYKDLFEAHRMLVEIEEGIRAVILVREKNVVVGCIHGTFEGDGDFVCHIMFKRNVNSLKGCLLCEKAMKEYCLEHQITFKRVVGYICMNNRAAIRLGKKYGAIDHGISNVSIWKDGYLLPCRKLIKEIL
jgi:hypothetical protein